MNFPKKSCFEFLSNYIPISNLFFLSKLAERFVLSHLNGCLISNNFLNPNQRLNLENEHISVDTALCVCTLQCYVMLCYMVICKAPLTGGYSEALSA